MFFFYRYVGYIIVAFKGTDRQISTFLELLNKLHPKIKFTIEIEENASIKFLDLNTYY